MAQNDIQTTIVVDLDEKSLNDSLKGLEKSVDKSASNIEKKVDKSLSNIFSRSFIKQIEETNNKFADLTSQMNINAKASKSLAKTFKTVDKSLKFINSSMSTTLAAFSTLSPIVIFLESRFGAFSFILDKMGLDLQVLIYRVDDLKAAFIGLALGKKGINDVRLSVGKLLQELGILDSTALGTLNTLDKLKISGSNVANSMDEVGKTAKKFVGFLTTLAPLAIYAEARFGLFSKVLEKLGYDLDFVKESFGDVGGAVSDLVDGDGGILGLKLSIGSLLEELGIIDSRVLSFVNSFKKFGSVAENIGYGVKEVGAFGAALVLATAKGGAFLKLSKNIGTILFKNKGFVSAASSAANLAVILGFVGDQLVQIDTLVTRTTGTLLKWSAIGLFSASAALTYLIRGLGDLAILMGGKITKYFEDATAKFVKASSALEELTNFVANFNAVTNDGVGSLESWNFLIGSLSEEMNLSSTSLRKASKEIISVGSNIGLTKDQMQNLLIVTSEFASVNGKDVFDASVAMVKGLNGQSDALVNYGVKLGTTAVKTFALNKMNVKNFDQLKENSKVQVRYNKLLKEYGRIAGLSALNADTLANQQKKLKINQERLTTAFGEGAAILNFSNLEALLYNKVLNNLGSTTTKVAGFLGVLGGTLLTGIGYFLKYSAAIFGVVKAYDIFKEVARSQLGLSLINAKLPIVGKSFNDLIFTISGAKAETLNLSYAFDLFKQGVVTNANLVTKALFGLELQALTVGKAFKILASRAIAALRSIYLFALPLLKPLAIAAAIVLALYAAFKLFEKVIDIINTKTNIFVDIYTLFNNIMSESSGIIDKTIKLFDNFISAAAQLGRVIIGRIVYGVSLFISYLANFISVSVSVFKEMKRLGSIFIEFLKTTKLVTNSVLLFNQAIDLAKTGIVAVTSFVNMAVIKFKALASVITDKVIAAIKIFIRVAAAIAKANPFNVFSISTISSLQAAETGLSNFANKSKNSMQRIKDGTVSSFDAISKSASKFGDKIKGVGYDFSLLPDNATRSIASTNEALKYLTGENLDNLKNKLSALRQEFEYFGLTTLEIISVQAQEKLATLASAVQNNLINPFEAGILKAQILKKETSDLFNETNKTAIATTKSINKTINGGLVKGVTAGFSAIGDALAGGEGGFEAFLGTILNIMGDMAIAIGTTVLTSALAIDGLKKSILGTGAVAIVIAGALIALGSAMKAGASGMTGSKSTASVGASGGLGGGGGGGVAASSTGEIAPPEEERTTTSGINVTIQGSVFDSSETGLRIVEAVNSAFDRDGAVIRTGIA